MPIRLLPSEVSSQIAAGEVVERPASVVKELLENSLDAGATFIAIQIEGAGQKLVEVTDDGCGISPGEISLSVERHATSKLSNSGDLFHITTLGFRGEALASIGSVSRLTIVSRQAEAPPLSTAGSSTMVGARLHVDGGRAGPVEPAGAPVGTQVRVEDLFYNVPARLKFLKHETTERRSIDTLVTRYALAYPQVRFHLHQDGRPVLQTSGNGDRREILAALFGVEQARQMLDVLAQDDGLRVSGYISPTSLTRSHRRDMTFFVNGRPVQDAALAAALLKGYHTLLMVGRYPVAVLFLEVPPEAVDVNVHPAKAEVRFREPERVFTGLQGSVRRALLAYTPIPGLQQVHWQPEDSPAPWSRQADPAWRWQAGSEPWQERHPPIDPLSGGEPAPTLEATQPALPARRVPILRMVGQVANAYLVAEGPDGLYLIDQHAAHERVLFERFMAMLPDTLPGQSLLQPAAIDLPPASARLLVDQLPVLSRMGFDVEAFGPHTFLVRAVPALLAGSDPAAALRVLVEDFEEDETPLQAEREARLVARVCKRAAVKAGHALSQEEQKTLLSDLEACQSPRTCPHGRPTMIHLSVDLLERQFGRKGAR